MPRLHPLSPIFNVEPRYGTVELGAMIGTIPPCVPSISLYGALHDAVALDLATTFTKDGDTAYVIGSASIASVDVTSPASPTLLDAIPSYPIGGTSAQIVQVGAYLYSFGNTGITIFDPASPEIVPSRFFAVTDGAVTGVVDGSYMYVTSWGSTGRVQVLDITNPLAPSLVGSVTDNTLFSNAKGIAKSGNYVFVCGFGLGRFTVVDVTNPAAPAIVANLSSANVGSAYGVVVSGNYAYVAASAGLTVIDISTPTSPTVAAHVNGLSPIGGSPRWVLKDGNTLYITAGPLTPALWVFNVTTPTAPTAIGSLNMSALGDSSVNSSSLVKSGNYLYISSDSVDRIRVVDVSTPASPTSVGTLTSSDALDTVSGLFLSGSTIYAVGVSQFSTVDITTPTAPAVTYTTHGDWLSGGTSILKVGDYLICGLFQNTIGRITTIDASDPTDMAVVTTFTHANLAGINAFVSDGTYLYATSQFNDRITVLDISNPLAISYVTFITNATTLDGATYLALVGTHLYVAAANTSRLTVVDVSTPATPTISGSVASTSLLTSAFGVAVSGNYAYVCALTSNRLTVVDISNPAAPVVVGSVRDDVYLNRAYAVAYENDKCYVTCQTANRVTVVDVANPANPIVGISLQDNTNLNRPVWIAKDGEFLYTANTLGDRLTILDYPCDTPFTASLPLTISPAVVTASRDIPAVAPVPRMSVVGSVTNVLLDQVDRVIVDGSYAYVVSVNNDRLITVDVSTPSAPSVTGSATSSSSLDQARALAKSGNFVFVASTIDALVSSYDVSTPATPTLSNTVFSATHLVSVRDINISGSVAVAVSRISGTNNRVVTIDISNPASMSILGFVQDSRLDNANRVVVSGNYAYAISDSTSDGLIVVDISTPATPTVVGSVADATNLDSPLGLWKDGNTVYISCSTRLVSVDVTTPSSPTILHSVSNALTNQMGAGICKIGDYVFVSKSLANAILAVNVANPSSMVPLGNFVDSTNLSGVADITTDGTYIYAAVFSTDRLTVLQYIP